MTELFDCSMPNRYRTSHDIQKYLSGTIIRWKGTPYMIEHVSDTTSEIYLQPIFSGVKNRTKITFNDPDLDISSIEIGYFNFTEVGRNHVAYVKRIPYRRWKQGIEADSLSILAIDGQRSFTCAGIYNTGFADSLVGNFPSYENVMDRLKIDSDTEFAISQSIALQKRKSDITLVFFRTEEIGYIKPGGNTIFIASPRKAWIVEQYLEDLNWKIDLKVA